MINRILVPLDGSPLAEAALPYVNQLLGERDVAVCFLTVLSPEEDSGPATLYLKSKESGGKAKNVEIKVLQAPAGKTAETILSAIEAWNPDLVAMTTHGRSGVTRWVFGSVADKLIHATARPFLLIRPPDVNEPALATSMDVITVPLDGSEISLSVMGYVQELALSLKARLHLVHVIAPPIYLVPDGIVASYPVIDVDEWSQQARSLLETTAEKIRGTGLVVQTEVRIGSAVQEIIDAANLAGSGLIAMATHGHSGLERWVLGSVADAVLRRSNLPCLIIRPDR